MLLRDLIRRVYVATGDAVGHRPLVVVVGDERREVASLAVSPSGELELLLGGSVSSGKERNGQ